MAAKTLKNQYRLQIVTFKLSRKGKKTQTRKEKPKATYSMAFLSAENENRQLKDLPSADFGRLPEILVLINRRFCFEFSTESSAIFWP